MMSLCYPPLMSLSIVIPAYNEEGAIAPVLTKLVSQMEESGLVYEIVVVDDGSTDETAVIAQQQDGITLIRHRKNKGYGASLKTGIRQAQYDLICITDADGTYPNGRIPDLYQHLQEEKLDMVVGARIGDNVHIPLLRRPPKWALRQLANKVAGEKIPDLNSGLRIFQRDVAIRMFSILSDRFSFTTTITLAMITNQYEVDFVPIDYHARVGNSKIRPIHDTIGFTSLILRMALYFKPIKIFGPLSLFLFVIGIGWGLLTAYWGQLADVSTIVIIMTSFQVAMVGLLAELINRRLPNTYKA